MKRILSIVITLVLVLLLAVPAFATGETGSTETTGSITITNATVGQTYTLYKIFDATYDASSDAVSYSIQPSNQFFSPLFGEDGTTENEFFNYNSGTGAVTKKAAANDTELIAYLTNMLTSLHTPAADPIKATDSQIVFNNLPYGYYMVLSSLGSAVTINSNTPDVEVIDKNQTPGANFEKKIQTGVDAEGNPIWGDSNTVSIGDKVTYRISFTATNYDRINQIQYYQVHDNKGNAIWAEFNNFKVYVNGTELPRGYYLCAGDSTELNTDNWEYLGVWNGVEKNRNNAQWYLVHLGYDQYRISIPWLEGHTIIDITDSNGKIIGYKPTFPPSAAPKYSSPAEVVVTYDAAVEPNADIGGLGNGNLYNTAHVAWTSKNETQATSPDTVVIRYMVLAS